METIKEGWLEIRSKYLFRWEWKWVVLNTSSISIFKDSSPTSDCCIQIPITEIVNVCPAEKNIIRDFALLIHTQKRKLFVSSDKLNEITAWQMVLKPLISSEVPQLSNRVLQQKIMADMKVVNAASKLKRELINREEELQAGLDEIYLKGQEKLQQNLVSINQLIEREERLLSEFQSASNSESNPLYKLRKVYTMVRPAIKLQEIDEALKSKIKVNISEDMVTRLLKNHMQTALGNIKEYKISRSRMPWAIKWKYNGSRVDAISLRTSKSILLQAVGICSPYKESGCTCVKAFCILDGPGTSSPAIYTHPHSIFMEYTGKAVCKIPLKDPVSLNANAIYTLCFQIQGSPTFRCKDCTLSEEGEGDVIVEFFNSQITVYKSNKTDTITGTIADLYYQLI